MCLAGHDFADEVRLLFQVVAAGPGGPPPAGVDPATLERHASWVRPRIAELRRTFIEPMGRFLVGLQPPGLPERAVYPFGGGDLLTALTTYPHAREITTLSLEPAGDPRGLAGLAAEEMAAALETFRQAAERLLLQADLDTRRVTAMQNGPIPGQIAYFLLALHAFDLEPVHLRFFRLADDGSPVWLERGAIAELAGTPSGRIRRVESAFSVAFRNSEIVFRPRGGGPERVHRHIVADLSDEGMQQAAGLAAHLQRKGPVCLMVKAASYFLWRESHARIRSWMLKNAAFMVGDSTGVLPSQAQAAGFETTTYGVFHGAFLENEGGLPAAEMRALFASEPFREMPYRYGYSDTKGAPHLIVYRPTTSSS
jgi:hypothetical protein